MSRYFVIKDKAPKKDKAAYTKQDILTLCEESKIPLTELNVVTKIPVIEFNSKDEALAAAKAQSTKKHGYVIVMLLYKQFSVIHVEPTKASRLTPAVKTGLISLLVATGAAALTFSGLLPVASLAAQFALATAIIIATFATIYAAVAVAKAVVKAVSAVTNTVKNYWNKDNAVSEEPKNDVEVSKKINLDVTAENVLKDSSPNVLDLRNRQIEKTQPKKTADVAETAENKTALKKA